MQGVADPVAGVNVADRGCDGEEDDKDEGGEEKSATEGFPAGGVFDAGAAGDDGGRRLE